jgi:hypothetical protein
MDFYYKKQQATASNKLQFFSHLQVISEEHVKIAREVLLTSDTTDIGLFVFAQFKNKIIYKAFVDILPLIAFISIHGTSLKQHPDTRGIDMLDMLPLAGQLSCLSLRNVDFNEQQLCSISFLIQTSTTLKQLRIVTCNFNNNKDFEGLAMAIQDSTSIRTFEMSNIVMNNESMQCLINAIQNNTVMHYLCLENIRNVPSHAFLDIVNVNKTILIMQIIGFGFTLIQNDIDVMMESNFTILQISWMPLLRNQRFANQKGLLKLLLLLCAARRQQPGFFIPSDIMYQVALSLADIIHLPPICRA